jgi:inosose dehydratase
VAGAGAGSAGAARRAGEVAPLTGIGVANAPCSYGAFEITVGVLPNVPGPDEVVAAIAEAGYDATELGPPGYLGVGEVLRDRLQRAGLALAGGFIPIRFSEREHLHEDLGAMERTLDLFEAADGREARAVLADDGSQERLANPGRAVSEPGLGLDAAGWRRLAEGVNRACELARSRGFEPVFHPHTGSYVEAPWEVERLLELTDVGIVLDTGHVTLGGGDAQQALADWRARIEHVHIKDLRLDVLRGVLRDRADMPEAWRRGVFCELGTGDVDLPAFFADLEVNGYTGWLVVEQDWVPGPDDDVAEQAAAQARNRQWLRENAGL